MLTLNEFESLMRENMARIDWKNKRQDMESDSDWSNGLIN